MTFNYVPAILHLDGEAIQKVAGNPRGFLYANVIVLAIIICLSTAQVYFGLDVGLTDFQTPLASAMFALTVFFLYASSWLMAATLFFANKLIGNKSFTIKEVYSVVGHFYPVTLLALVPYGTFPGFIYLALLQSRTIQVLAQTKLFSAIGTWAIAFLFMLIIGNLLYVGIILVGAYIEIATGSVNLF